MADETQVRVDKTLLAEAAAELDAEEASATHVANEAIKAAVTDDQPVATATLDELGETIEEANEAAIAATKDDLETVVDTSVDETETADPSKIAAEVAERIRPQLIAASHAHLQDADLLRQALPIEDGALRVREVE